MRKINKIQRVLFTEHAYAIAYRQLSDSKQSLLIDGCGEFRICMPSNRFWHADPILYQGGEKLYVFTEMYDRYRKRGAIGVSFFDDNGELTKAKKVIEEPFHMSFPFIFCIGEDVFMLPETVQSKELRIYKKGETLYDWSLYRNVYIENLVDTVVCISEEENILYFISGLEDPDERNKTKNKLRIFTCPINSFEKSNKIFRKDFVDDTEKLYGKDVWQYQVRNGGYPFRMNGKLFRLVQDCDKEHYGKAFCFYQIEKISQQAYKEKIVRKITPDDLKISGLPNNVQVIATHTYGIAGNTEIIDCYVRIQGGYVFPRKVLREIVWCFEKLFGKRQFSKVKKRG